MGNADFYEHLGRSLHWYYSPNSWEYPIAIDLLAKENPKSFLEVGCGAGHFLRLARKRGYEGHGCEMNPHSVETLRAEGFHILTDLDHGVSHYDAILMFQLLEHLLDPFSFLKSLLPYLQPGGVVVITTPITPSCAAFNANPFLFPPHHQWLPTARAFEHLAERLGLACETTLFQPPDSEQVAYALRKWCGRFPYSEKLGRYWSRAGRYALRIATGMGCKWAKIGHTGMAILRKP
ncbi:MAG: class I SAM-dependent methyltransferase [Nitrospirota bacterium]